MLTILFFEKNIFVTILKSIGNIIILGIVIFLQLGYNPISVNIPSIHKVYPWKVIISESSNQFGIYDAIYGDTLLIPEFKKDSISNFYYYKVLPRNSYTSSLTGQAVVDLPYPLRLTKLGTGDWKLTLMYYPNYEHAISKFAHLKATDSTIKTNKGGANLFIKLRNDISSFCISGNDSILLSDILYINQYEEIIQQDLSHSLHQLAINDSILTEAEIVPFIKALSRSVYMNMLKESILNSRYNDFISWYSSFYIPVTLTSITSENGIKWSAKVNSDCDLSLNSGENNIYESNQSITFSVTLDGLNDNRLYAWNNLFYALFLLECNAYAPKYGSDMNRKIHDDNIVMERMLENMTEMSKKLTNHHGALQKQNESLHNILNILTEKNSRGEKLSTEEISQTLQAIIGVNSISNTVKNNISTDMNSYRNNIISITDSLKTIALLQADIQFEKIITGTFDSLTQIIKANPTNAYNGLLISLCQELYVIGVMRGYDMNEYADKMTHLDQAGTLPLYNFVKRIDAVNEQRTQMLDSLSNQLDSLSNQIVRGICGEERRLGLQ